MDKDEELLSLLGRKLVCSKLLGNIEYVEKNKLGSHDVYPVKICVSFHRVV
jgi:hypothetical protein